MPGRHPTGRRLAVAFGAHGALVGTWAGRVPAIKHALGLSDTRLGVALLAMAVGTLAGSRSGGPLARRAGAAAVVRVGLPAMGAALVAVAVERDRRRPQMAGFHGAWSIGLLLGASGASAAAGAGVGVGPGPHFAAVAAVDGRRGAARADRVLQLLRGGHGDRPERRLHARPRGRGSGGRRGRVRRVRDRDGRVSPRGRPPDAVHGPVRVTRAASAIAAAGLALAPALPHPITGIAGFAIMGAELALIVPTILSAAGAAGAGVEAAISRVLLIAYTGSIAGPAAIGFTAGRTGLRLALLLPLALTVCIGLAAGRLRAAAGGELART